MEAKLLYKYGTIYREVLHTPVIDWCRFMSENDDPSKIIVKSPLALLYAVIRDSVPSIIHKCPYTVSSSYFELLILLQNRIVFRTLSFEIVQSILHRCCQFFLPVIIN